MKRKIGFFVLMGLLFAFSISALAQEGDNSLIIGKWQGETSMGEISYKFRPDDTGLANLRYKNTPIIEKNFVYCLKGRDMLCLFPPVSENAEWVIKNCRPDAVYKIEVNKNDLRIKVIQGEDSFLGAEEIRLQK
ncbi:hypothetical protein COS59_00110 [Candidatus Wolfebacteria bacterium CG03_land_8_20_14_0_80_36_15]|uniref:DUF5640 domain-containing protein n=1 Tax=Candidatus Wolfebacteria bacterium CG03_land_8_20_14_0_80_36_15 TaxID=1975067 RepID=A0A2M7B8B7_9BACT|nr:MAG: hypothetical protein COS59_00110 [Candidatus Wolfebacteria bacterium CG03_land_8_20_14_0_80_36_15]